MDRLRYIASACALLVICLATTAEAKKLYRWVDDTGKVYYSDRVPPEQSDKERAILDSQGLQVEKVDEAKTREELILEHQRKLEVERLRRAQQKLIEAQAAEDRILLRTFSTEQDITLARDNKLGAIDVSIQIMRSNIHRVKDRLAHLQRSAANKERQGKKVPRVLEEDIARGRAQLQSNYATMIAKEREKEQIFAQFAIDMGRFRELKNIAAPTSKTEQDRQRSASLLNTVVACDTPSQCDPLWAVGEAFTHKYTTTKMQIISDTIILSAAPKRVDDISITLSRIESKGDSGYLIFMDLQCSNTPSGIDLCASERVKGIKGEFGTLMEAKKRTLETTPKSAG